MNPEILKEVEKGEAEMIEHREVMRKAGLE